MLHEPAVQLEADLASKKKSRLGLILFLFYALIYAGFVYIGIFQTHLLGIKAIGNTNLAVVYGMGLIVLAAVMGYIYSELCTQMERKANKECAK